MKNSNDTIGNRTCDLPTFSAVSQPTAPPRAPFSVRYALKSEKMKITNSKNYIKNRSKWNEFVGKAKTSLKL
jgi:hypothetical protein